MRFFLSFIILLLGVNLSLFSQIKLTHNVGDNLVRSYVGSCEETEHLARTFTLLDFGVNPDEEFIIDQGEIGLYMSVADNSNLSFNIYEIDFDFPNSFDESKLIGSSQVELAPPAWSGNKVIFTINFETPVIVPAGVERILVEVKKEASPGGIGVSAVQLAGTEEGNDFSWYKGCLGTRSYIKSTDFGSGRPPSNLFINVTGVPRKTKEIPFSVENLCFGDTAKFILEETVDSIHWDFGDPISGANNTSTDLESTHVFSEAGTYEVSVIASLGGNTVTEVTTITIYEQPIASKPNDIGLCTLYDDNSFDLYGHNKYVLNGLDSNVFGVHYYEGIENYNNGIKINAPEAYTNALGFFTQEIIAEVYNKQNPECNDITKFNIGVYKTPQLELPNNISNLTQCDNSDSGSDTDGIVVFDLTEKEQYLLLNGIDSEVHYNYYTDEDLKQPIASPNTFVNSQSSQTIYVECVSNLNSECKAITSFIVEVLKLPSVTPIVELKQCDDDLDGLYSAFNLNEVINEITTNADEEKVSFFESELKAENDQDPITNLTTYSNNTPSLDVVWARVENKNGCFRVSKVNLIVTTTKIPLDFKREFYTCDDDFDGISNFSFETVHDEIASLFPAGQELIITYYQNEPDALAEVNKIENITDYSNIGYPYTQDIYVRVDSRLNNDCLGLGAHITLHVEANPVANPVTITRECDDDFDGKYPFDVSEVELTVLGSQSLSDVSIFYYDENDNPLPSPLPNPFLTSSQIIKVVVENNNIADGSCFDETTLEFIVDKKPVANMVSDLISCDDGINDSDGLHDFDTSLIESSVLNGQTGMEVHYYNSLGIELPSPLPNPFRSNTQTVTVKVVNPLNSNCIASTDIQFIVNPLPDFTIENSQIVCSSDPTFTIVLDPLESNANEIFNYEWVYEDGTVLSNAPTLTVSTPGTYFITLTKTDGTGCSRTRDVFVNASELANIIPEDIVIEDVSNNNKVIINTNNLGQGEYEYALDDEFSSFQDSPIFENVSSGIHTVYVRDKKGCGTASIEVSVIGFLRYFTPNGDGINDTWYIPGVNDQFQIQSDIFIYNRYGKLLKQLNPSSNGWDGTFKGEMLPTDDYWFSVILEDGRVFKGHFALKR
ncbi:T9SS type B sorting domain-containing protein [Aestuariibaculum lutulentum]|uniref:T9SS type B sorting domain-containing protein n=1 Tax=Aestuariibaculum lutulentum TaxID=2920935 RepID=A0ABS9RG91_9FLAO|nr:T9SS type B sorting domain-containing protein [Aestuariibaculum lutulentum]MCH4551968.1 T9SS type B sorting domain-containing protein [Aestuariibaculum lutulentum]